MSPTKASNHSRMIPVQHEPSVSILLFIAALGWNPQAASLSVKLEVRSASGRGLPGTSELLEDPHQQLRRRVSKSPSACTAWVLPPALCPVRMWMSDSDTHVSALPLENEGEPVGSDDDVCVRLCVCVTVCEPKKWNSSHFFLTFFICIQMILLFLILLSWGWRPAASLNMVLYYDYCSYDFHSHTDTHAAFGLHSQGIPAHDYEEQGLRNHMRKSSRSEPAYCLSFNDPCWAPTMCRLSKFFSPLLCCNMGNSWPRSECDPRSRMGSRVVRKRKLRWRVAREGWLKTRYRNDGPQRTPRKGHAAQIGRSGPAI